MRNVEDLNTIYRESEQVDQEILAEMRSNCLLTAGDHYTRKNSRFYNGLRGNQAIPEDTRIRLTKNHLGKIVRTYVNNIVSYAPGITASAKNESEMQDQKSAELHNAVWMDAKERLGIDRKVQGWANDLIEIGESHGYIYWDKNKGDLVGYKPQAGEDGQPMMDEMGQPTPDRTQPVYRGDFCFERIYGFNIRRSPECESFDESAYLIINRMAKIKDLKKIYANDPKKLAYIQESSQRTFRVFDGLNGNYRPLDPTECLVRYYYFRPSLEEPEGRYYIATEFGVLEDEELPFGIFPIVSETCEDIPTTPRGRSIIKQIRPYQAEINRAASKIAEHQITLGDDKLVIQGSAKVSSGTNIPGVRTIQVAGSVPTVLPGRAGDQYVGYMQSQIAEMYQVVDLDLDEQEKGQVDPYTLLFKSASQRKKFIRYTKRFESFLIRLGKLYFDLAKKYLPDDAIIRAAGRKEIVNIKEFKNSDPSSYEVIVEASNDDLETKMGRQILLSQALQYVGSSAPPELVGQLIRAMPYANLDETLEDVTINFDSARNMMLALERGEQPIPNMYDTAPYMIQKLSLRTRQADFKYLDQNIQANYEKLIQAYEEQEAEKKRQIAMQESQMIPMGGPRVKADIYVNTDPANPNKVTRASLPYDALNWLLEKLNQQGALFDSEQTMPEGAQAQIASKAMTPPQPMQPNAAPVSA